MTYFCRFFASKKCPYPRFASIAALLWLSTTYAHENQPTSLIPPHSSWKYQDQGQVDQGWQNHNYNDDAWPKVAAPLGYGETDLNQPSLREGRLDYYLRHNFTVHNRKAIRSLTLRARYDDAALVYLNGIELLSTPSLRKGKIASHEADTFESFTNLPVSGLRNGSNTLAVKLLNRSHQSSDLVWDASLLAGDAPRHEAPQASSDNILRGPYLQNACQTAITIRWRTETPTRGRIHYWQQNHEMRFFQQEPIPTTEHSIRLHGLSQASTYNYYIDSSNQQEPIEPHTFSTLPAANQAAPTRIWIIGDSGTGNDKARAVYQAYRKFTAERPADVWLMLGDNAYAHGTDQQFQDAVFNIYTPLLHNTCLWPAVGNHETYWSRRDNNPLTNNLADPYLAIFEMPTNGEAGGVPSANELYYSFDYGRTHFICLDSQISDRSTSGEMYHWLKADLEQATDDHYDWIIAYWHHPPYTHGTHNSDTEQQHIDMRENFLPLLEAHGVDLTFGGHSHTYERSILMHGHYGKSHSYDSTIHALDPSNGDPNRGGGYHQAQHQGRGTIHTVAGSSGKCGKFVAKPLPFMVKNLSKLASVIVDINGRSLKVTTLGSQSEVLDCYTLHKD